MSILTKRQNLYGVVTVVDNMDGTYSETYEGQDLRRKVTNIELDYLDSKINLMNLSTVDKFVVSSVFQYRADLISDKYYGTYDLGWLIALHNGFMDITFSFEIGTVINIPSRADYYRFYNNFGRDF